MRKWPLLIFLLVGVFFPFSYTFSQGTGAGFIPGNIWYSKDPFMEGDKIKIYTLVFNPDQRELSGIISFFDKNVLLGNKNFIVSGGGVRDVSIDWNVTAGTHIIYAKIENAKFLISPGKYENTYLSQNETEESRRTVSKSTGGEKTEPGSVPETDRKIQELVTEKTPDFISRPLIAAVDKIEKFRQDMAKSEEKIHIIFQNRLIFYGISVLIVFLIARFVWKKVL